MNLLKSSVDPSKIALTVKGLSALVPMIVLGLAYFKVNVGSDDLNALINGLSDLILLVGTVVTAVLTLFGLARKIYNEVFAKE